MNGIFSLMKIWIIVADEAGRAETLAVAGCEAMAYGLVEQWWLGKPPNTVLVGEEQRPLFSHPWSGMAHALHRAISVRQCSIVYAKTNSEEKLDDIIRLLAGTAAWLVFFDLIDLNPLRPRANRLQTAGLIPFASKSTR